METPQRARRTKREAILRATAGAIASHGVRGMRVETVAADAGVSVALLYYHFQNRIELTRAALHYAHERAPSTGALAELPPHRMAYDALEAALLAELDDAPEVRDFSIVWGELAACAVFETTLRADFEFVCRSWTNDVARAIRAGISDGSIASDTDPECAAQVLTTLADGLCARWLAGVVQLEEARGLLREALQRELRPPDVGPAQGDGRHAVEVH